MSIQSSFPKVADQILSFNRNIVEILGKLSSLANTTSTSVNIQIQDENGNLRNFALPTTYGLKADIERLDRNIKSLYALDTTGALISTSTQNVWKKIITVDLNREPLTLANLNLVNNFKTSPNWFFDSLLDPMMQVEFDLTNKVENNIRKCLSRRYIVEFAKDTEGNFTTLGQSAINSFDANYKNNTSISVKEFENWHRTTPGIVNPLNPKFDEQMFDLEPNNLLYDGEFEVFGTDADDLNRKLWYVLDRLDYSVIETGEVRQLAINDELLVNVANTSGVPGPASTRYKIIEISRAQSRNRIRLELVEGYMPVTSGKGTLKLYSPVVYDKKVKISIGFNERNVIFVKTLNAETNLMARQWSNGVGFYTSELTLNSEGDANGLSMEQFYQDYVYDYGEVLKDLVAKKIPANLAGTPNAPTLNVDNFKVVQINQHLTDTPDSNLIKQKHNIQINLKAEIDQLQNAVNDRFKKIKIAKFKSTDDKKKSDLEVKDLLNKRELKSKQLETIAKEIISISKIPGTKVDPKFRVRGFWSMPESVATRGSKPQEVVQFEYWYRYLSKDGKQNPVESFSIDGQQDKAQFSDFQKVKTDARKRGYDAATGEYFWQIEDVTSAETPNINQIDIPIQANEKVEVKVRSISEVGWPDSPVYSDWSDTITIEFPDDLNNVLNENDFILQEASKDDLRIAMNNELSAKGLDEHLSDQVNIDTKIYHHDSANILSGFKDENGNVLDLYEYLSTLQERIKSLEEKIERAKGELEIVILRNNQEFIVANNSETTFNVECEDYLEKFTATGVPTGRVYQNNIYVIKDFVIRVRNKSVNSPLGLLSNRTYLQNSQVYNSGIPQVFWVNDKDELMTSDTTGSTKTQINNQFIWSVNYDSVTDTSTSKLSENIGNSFTTNNSLTTNLSNNSYNLGYSEQTVLAFLSNNKSLLEPAKWIDNTTSVASTTKLLTTIHPVSQDLEKVTETNSEKVKTLNGGSNNDVIIPLNIYFKMNSLDSNQSGLNYEYVDLNKTQKTVKHVKKIKFFLENEAENRPFQFSIKFNINRNKVIVRKVTPALNLSIK